MLMGDDDGSADEEEDHDDEDADDNADHNDDDEDNNDDDNDDEASEGMEGMEDVDYDAIYDDQADQDEKESDKEGDGDWEDIYGRKRSKDGKIIQEGSEDNRQVAAEGSSSGGGKYVPPALRKAAGGADKKKELERLAKQLKGNLNRLAASNMHSIAGQIENMYRNNSRNDMNQTLYDLMSTALISATSTPERLVMEYVMLIAILHANIGSEVILKQACIKKPLI